MWAGTISRSEDSILTLWFSLGRNSSRCGSSDTGWENWYSVMWLMLRCRMRNYLFVDATGLKAFGEGEWTVRQHGMSKQRIWRTLHLMVDTETQDIVASVVTEFVSSGYLRTITKRFYPWACTNS